ncbi:Hypothetical predicted protein [Olea europaea subsp. europaea]|uniref:Amino acid transporter transmembrane domain-containing protein n=1 Tax=Olea europaea subsp. europaea TaxID=158383 RepID=A0A8S0QNG8_OLEEU|nr:Hypothetical predicted protein [Olea europaea subsp. europaea]
MFYAWFIVFVGVLIEFSVGMLLRFSKAGGVVSYGGIMGDAFGNVGRRILEVSVVINNIGVLTVYIIIIDSLRYTSALAVILAFVFLVITAYISVFKLVKGSTGMPRLLPDITDIYSVWKLFTFVPVLVTAYVCHFNVHNIENKLEDSSRMRSVVQTSLALCSIVYITTSFFGFLLFGDSTLDDVLANLDSNLGIPYSLLNDTVCICYVVHLMFVFPTIFHPLRLNLDGLLFPSSVPLVQILFPTFGMLFSSLVQTAAVCIGFIFPAAIALRNAYGIGTKEDKFLAVFMIGLAVFANLVAIYSDAYTTFKRNASPME